MDSTSPKHVSTILYDSIHAHIDSFYSLRRQEKLSAQRVFICSLIFFTISLNFFTICADIFCYKLCNTYYKLCNKRYKLCNKKFQGGNENFQADNENGLSRQKFLFKQKIISLCADNRGSNSRKFGKTGAKFGLYRNSFEKKGANHNFAA